MHEKLAVIDQGLVGRSPTPSGGCQIAASSMAFLERTARARQSAATAARRERQQDEACEPKGA